MFLAVFTDIAKMPVFVDEFKLVLPEKLQDGHHILFTFLHVSCKDLKPNDKSPIEKIIGLDLHWLDPI